MPNDVKLVLAVGQHRCDIATRFSGPAEWKTEAEAAEGAGQGDRAPRPTV